ncbi:CAP domain-containing protein [Rhodococcus pyridinivorans]|uniref:CAP domain-containing protein n=1 Tax=Rhodococcus pyridinivorans TaxID=103816 RepID=UPI000761CAC8|nr:CAP domain-containing protein [Rhodococcus pyridinivorans]
MSTPKFLALITLPAIGVVIGLVLVDHFFFQPRPAITPQSTVSSAPIAPNVLEALVNQERTSKGLSALETSSQLRNSACGKADHLLQHDYFAHVAPNGTTPWSFIDQAGYQYTLAGENLAEHYPDNYEFVQAWMNSPSHRANVLGEFSEQGICEREGMVVMHVGVR